MTCTEKLILDHPDWSESRIERYMEAMCPSYMDYLDDPNYCDNGASKHKCVACWYRDIPVNKEEDKMNDISTNQSVATIKDSGDRTRFESGAQRDMRAGKGRFDVMPLEVVNTYLVGFVGKKDNALTEIALFQRNYTTLHLYKALGHFVSDAYDGSDETMLLDVAKHYEAGAVKYEPDNWRRGIPAWCYIDSAVRHYVKWHRGDNDENHAAAFIWNLMCCIWEVDYGEEWRKERVIGDSGV